MIIFKMERKYVCTRNNPIENRGPKLILHTNYYDKNNQVIVIVYRYDPPLEKKQFKPFDVKK